MEFFGYIPLNVIYAQIVVGLFTGFCLGLSIPSEYEKNKLIQDILKVWTWQKYISHYSIFTPKGLFYYLLKVTLVMAIVAYIDVWIIRFFGVAPMAKHAPHNHIMCIFFLISIYIGKYARYKYFDWKLNSSH